MENEAVTGSLVAATQLDWRINPHNLHYESHLHHDDMDESPLSVLEDIAEFGWGPGIYQHLGLNRSGKSLLSALFGFFAWLGGMEVLCNCPVDPYTGSIEHIIRYPHTDYQPGKLIRSNLLDTYVMTDQAEQIMDATAPTKAVRQLGYFGYQAKKRRLSWHYDTVRVKNIYNRVRLNPDFTVETERIPKDWRQSLQAIKVKIWATDEGHKDSIFYLAPADWEPFFRLYNTGVMLTPPELEA